MQTLALALLVTVAIGGIGWVFVYPILSGERRVEQRRESVARSTPTRTARVATSKSRRDQVEETLRDIEAKNKVRKSPPLGVRISQAGLSWSKERFLITSGVFGFVSFLAFLIVGAGILPSLALGFAAGFGVPTWALKFLKNRREAKFLKDFPDAVDVIVRGIKSGLPVMDCIKIIVGDFKDPIKTEFRSIVETQAIGMPLGDACLKLYERMPVPEANFFGIVIFIQQKSGGNLSEALGNLSRVLRDRKKMKAKIQAMSMEAKASGAIIGCLPLIVMGLVYITSPQYIALLWTHNIGNLLLLGSVIWMSMGVFVMRKMINFDF